jgi:hypothetical protein
MSERRARERRAAGGVLTHGRRFVSPGASFDRLRRSSFLACPPPFFAATMHLVLLYARHLPRTPDHPRKRHCSRHLSCKFDRNFDIGNGLEQVTRDVNARD